MPVSVLFIDIYEGGYESLLSNVRNNKSFIVLRVLQELTYDEGREKVLFSFAATMRTCEATRKPLLA